MSLCLGVGLTLEPQEVGTGQAVIRTLSELYNTGQSNLCNVGRAGDTEGGGNISQ